MLSRMRIVLAIAVLAASCAIPAGAITEKAAAPKPPEKRALAQDEVTQLLLLMDTDKNGKISKEEWMKFMESEFDRMDKDKSGELDAKEIAQSKFRVSRFSNAGK